MASGQVVHLPEAGAVMDQSHFGYYLPGRFGMPMRLEFDLLSVIQVARRVWYVLKYIPANGMSPSDADQEFIAWVISNG